MKIQPYKASVLILLICVTCFRSYAQQNVDVGVPANTPFQLGADITGTIENSINEVTGKVSFSVPLSAIASGPVSYSLNIGYNGESAFRIGSELNKYNSTSILGVGWSLGVPKIVVNNKQTTTREDDVFYIIDGETNTKLICVNKESTYWEFKTEKFSNWIIKYYHQSFNDRWEVTKEDGLKYHYGTNVSGHNTREYVSTWGNWIGDSNQNPTGVSTLTWNIYKIEDQWNNNITFKYELVEGQQNLSQTLYKHTEASYLKEILSSRGSKILLNYDNKNPPATFISEYYEPHKEKQEPDAYQERYEKKFLSSVEVFNTNNQLVLSYDLGYDLQALTSSDDKRYLTSITQVSHYQGQSNALPPQEFEYHYSGTFKGGLKKVIYPSGGSVVYNYQNKYLFNNDVNNYETTPNLPSTYFDYGVYVSDHYNLLVRMKNDPVTGNKYNFDFYRYCWNGMAWDSNRFQFPDAIEDNTLNGGGEWLKDFYTVFEDDFYAFLLDKGTTGDLHMFHKQKSGNSWHYQKVTVSIGDDEPRLLAGDDFIAVGTHHTGDLYTYNWNGAYWGTNPIISQGAGQYYYTAKNNFILSLNEDGGNDMITGTWHHDNYYMHYMDAEKLWQTKSWSAFADPFINDIRISDDEHRYHANIFPTNSIAGYVIKNNNEMFLRWDTNYNLIAVDDIIGAYDDDRIFQPVNNSMFTLIFNGTNNGKVSARFNGVNWSHTTFSDISRYTNYDIDFVLFEGTSTMMKYKEYSPNTHSWIENNLNSYTNISNFYWNRNSINREFFIAGESFYKRTNLGVPAFPIQNIGTLPNYNYFSYSDGLSHIFVNQFLNNTTFSKGSYYYINKETGFLSNIDLGSKYHIISSGNGKIGGRTPFMSPRAIWLVKPSDLEVKYLYRIIDDEFDQSIYDIVVSSVELNDNNSSASRKIYYSYNNANPSANNDVTYYGEVTTEHKGFGTSSNGKIKKIFDDGSSDIRRLGLLLEEHYLDANNNLERKITNQWQNILTTIVNSDNRHIDNIQHSRLIYKTTYEFGSNTIWNRTNYNYNSKSQVSRISNQNSKGQWEQQEFRYAHEQYTLVRDKNMLNGLYQTTTKNNNQVVDVKRNNWSNNSLTNKSYIGQKMSGSTLSNLRTYSNITFVDPNGNLLEAKDGQDIYNSILQGYSNLYEVASIVNARYQDVVNELDVNYSQLQNLNTDDLKIELMKLYDRLPNAMINLTFYDNNGRIVNTVNERQEESHMYYDVYGRLDYITDGYGNVLQRRTYNYGN